MNYAEDPQVIVTCPSAQSFKDRLQKLATKLIKALESAPLVVDTGRDERLQIISVAETVSVRYIPGQVIDNRRQFDLKSPHQRVRSLSGSIILPDDEIPAIQVAAALVL